MTDADRIIGFLNLCLEGAGKALAYLVEPYLLGPSAPLRLRLTYLREETTDVPYNVYTVELPPPTASDVASWQLGKSSGGGAETIEPIANGGELWLTQGLAYTLRIRQIDDAGKEGAWSESTETGVIEDQEAPSAPGALTLNYAREEPDDATPPTG